MKKSILWGVCLASALLAGCGGDDDPATPVPSLAEAGAVPDSVAQSEQGMATWVSELAAEGNDAKQSFDVAKFIPPTAENTEPVALR